MSAGGTVVRRRRAAAIAGAAGFAAAVGLLFVASWGKWCDAVVDVGSEWIYADTLARGGLLYRDVVYWFGPFTPYFEAAFFRVLGSSFRTLVVAGIVGSVASFAALWLALRRVTDRVSAALWTAAAVPALAFMPYSGGSILGMGHRMWHAAAFSLLAGAVVARRDFPRRPRLALAAGAFAGLAGLCRTEWGVATLGAAALAVFAEPRKARARSAVTLLGGAALFVWGAPILFFVLRAGAGPVLRDAPVLLAGVPAETHRFLWKFSGLADWPRGLATLGYSLGAWAAILLLLPLSASGRRPPLAWLAACAAALGISRAAGAALGGAAFSAAPVVCLLAAGVGLARGAGARSRALVVFGALGAALSFRRFLDIRDAGYVAPPLLFAAVCAAGLLRLAVFRLRRPDRSAVARRMRAAVAGVCGLFFVLRALHYGSDGRVPIPGAGGVLSAETPVVREIGGLVRRIRAVSRPDDGLVVAPEGAVLNFLAGRRNPIRYKLLIPGYLTAANEPDVLRALARDPPRVIVLWAGPTAEYGYRFFGEDYGARIRRWIDARYRFVELPEAARRVDSGATRLAIRRDAVGEARPAPLLR